ncbi:MULTISPECIES: rhodanese-like domain-containing protein [Trichocoleus]|uniref:Rhodanese-like domain-containing protein n=1 Tax=Trichocoleus desertorum GB2-A4 TaxID=2933944 RepID=A0ABV0J932_9CYAN|nr:rhodanese-like domain-containing protein [Trichocoleus sp. FACHB-46]
MQFPQVRWITTAELAQWLSNPVRSQPLLLDARTQAEYAVSHLATAQQIDPIAPDLAALGQIDQATPLVVYCSIGYRSAKVAAQLAQAGFTQVYDLEGSIFQWANEARPLWQAEQPTTKVHPYNAQWGLLLKPEYRAELQEELPLD